MLEAMLRQGSLLALCLFLNGHTVRWSQSSLEYSKSDLPAVDTVGGGDRKGRNAMSWCSRGQAGLTSLHYLHAQLYPIEIKLFHKLPGNTPSSANFPEAADFVLMAIAAFFWSVLYVCVEHLCFIKMLGARSPGLGGLSLRSCRQTLVPATKTRK